MNYYMHLLPGKIRIRTSALQKSETKISALTTFLRTVKGITAVKINPLSGSILIDYNRNQITSQVVIGLLNQRGYVPAFQVEKDSAASTRQRPSMGAPN